MKTTFKTIVLLLGIFIFSTTFTSCKETGGDNPPTPPQSDFSENFGNSVDRDFMGKIMDSSHNPISGATVQIGSDSATTDDNGIFIIEGATVYQRFAYIEVTKSGYLKGSRSLVPTDAMNQVSIILLDENTVGSVSSGQDGEVNLPNGTSVKFDGAFKDENGNAYSGTVSVMMQHLDPSDPDINLKMPGMLYAQNANNNERILETYGMLNVELRGSGGEKLNIADGHTATIEIPVDPTQTNAPSTIPLWHFNEEIGVWVEDSQADLVGGKYIGQVSHFSWWNCDAQFPTVNLCMQITDGTNPVYGIKVELWRANATYPNAGWSDGNGEICGLIPANETLTMKVIDPCGNLISTTSIGPFSSDTNLGTITISALQTSTITGTLLDCNNNMVTDGYVILKYGTYNELTYTVTNGTFTFTTLSCVANGSFTLEGLDNNSFQTTGEVSYTFITPATNVGNLIACNAIIEYITYQIDNDSPVVIISNLNASYYSSGNNYSINGGSDNNSNGWLYIGVEATAGTYTYGTNLSMEISTADLDYNQPINISATVNTNPIANIGDYIDIAFGGTYTDTQGNVRNITGVVHVKRDN